MAKQAAQDPTSDAPEAHAPETQAPEADASDVAAPDRAAQLVQAAREEVLAYGVRRATATSIARRAGVSRMTVYRHSGGIEQLVLEALYGEFEQLVTASAEGADLEASARPQIVRRVTSALHQIRRSPLVQALRQHDPELLLPYLIDHLGRGQELMRTLLREGIELGQRDGSVRRVDPDVAAITLLMALQGFVVSATVVADLADERAIDDEVALLVDRYLAPRLGA
ncbi:TetR/AcrR family transcriptional regulator [Barrientosiimonas humi]|uniref:TetR/AcrR family transcriptional regulator n=1 Tax=Barrientosiimonas humi TaxID=999931 RepID=UPI00370D32BD